MSNSDFIITLSWPEGKISAVGSWYDKILGLNRKYSIGHTSIILINAITREIYYLDFGSYQTPIGFGRVRDIETDPDLTIRSLVIIENNSINRIDEIIKEIYKKKSTHGEGKLYYKIFKKLPMLSKNQTSQLWATINLFLTTFCLEYLSLKICQLNII